MSAFGASDWFKKATMIGYARISTERQSKDDRRVKTVKKKATIKRQIAEVNAALKSQGLPQVKDENFFAEIASGTKEDRAQWRKAISKAMDAKGRVVMVVKDPSRWARNVDAAVTAWKPLKARGIPVYAVVTGIQTGTLEDKRPSENFFFLLNSGFAAQTSEVQQKKAEAAVKRQKEEGILAGKGTSLFPFARRDPLKVFLENMDMLTQPRGRAKLARLIELETMPNGMKAQSVQNLQRRIMKRIGSLSPDELESYMDYRDNIRERLQRLESDPWAVKGNEKGKTNYKANALLRMTGAYLKDPSDFEQRPNSELDEIELNFVEFLSDKDKDRRSKK
jgi:DNA invertase Pin-like site-specific DNA recombinase